MRPINLSRYPRACAQVNRALELAGHAERLVHGGGYFYFIEGDAHTWHIASVMTFHIDDLTIGEWLHERDVLAAGVPL